jgi:hypothetical protein
VPHEADCRVGLTQRNRHREPRDPESLMFLWSANPAQTDVRLRESHRSLTQVMRARLSRRSTRNHGERKFTARDTGASLGVNSSQEIDQLCRSERSTRPALSPLGKRPFAEDPRCLEPHERGVRTLGSNSIAEDWTDWMTHEEG